MTRRSFGFEIDALIAALDDASPEVRLTAGSHLAAIGLGDARVVPALCKAAREADDVTREGVGVNLERLVLDTAQNDASDDKLAQSYKTAVGELASVLETKGSGWPPADRHRAYTGNRELPEDGQERDSGARQGRRCSRAGANGR